MTSKKFYNPMAQEFASLICTILNSPDDHDIKDAKLSGVHASISAFEHIAYRNNSNFSSNYFSSYISEIVNGTRNRYGQKIPQHITLKHKRINKALISIHTYLNGNSIGEKKYFTQKINDAKNLLVKKFG